MSSVSGSDRSRQTDDIRSIREEYEKKEAELIKKQKRELQRAAERQDQQTSKIREEYGEHIQCDRGEDDFGACHELQSFAQGIQRGGLACQGNRLAFNEDQ